MRAPILLPSALTDTDFNRETLLLSKDNPTTLFVVEFTSDWCTAHGAYDQILEAVSLTHPEVRFLTANVDLCNKAACDLVIRSIPTLVLYLKGEIVERLPGVLPVELVEGFVIKHMVGK